jgi:hypothetical protein
MRSFLTLLTVLLFFTAFFSCKKSNSSTNGGGSVQGNWKFLYLTGQTNETAISSGVTDVTTSSFTSIDNSGTFDFTADSAIVTNLTYTLSGTELSEEFVSGTLLDSFRLPLSEAVPATSETVAYQQIGSDSLYFPSGSFSTAGTTGATQSSGARYVIKNDTLILTEQLNEIQSGVNVTAVQTAYLLKQ